MPPKAFPRSLPSAAVPIPHCVPRSPAHLLLWEQGQIPAPCSTPSSTSAWDSGALSPGIPRPRGKHRLGNSAGHRPGTGFTQPRAAGAAPGEGVQRHRPDSELEKGAVPGVAVSPPTHGRAPGTSPRRDHRTQSLRAAPRSPSARSTSTETGMEQSCRLQRSQPAPEDSGSPPDKPTAPNPSRSLRRPWQFTIPLP
ncbi:translation initiation factor IF-2-like [Pipra filicauda]|uniref:Translation initiation factor IF-2-like n=1 Tax=Pipra filicauda TaxID=649802 RepID=A0A7R5L7J5_9PASS|nr:translation initiation factor IF-2-like [Pipra filicauda]